MEVVSDASREFLDKTTLADIPDDTRRAARHGTTRKQH
jgi:hypothetical protein